MIWLCGVSLVESVAFLDADRAHYCSLSKACLDFYLPHRFCVKAHEHIPLLLIPNCRQPSCLLVLLENALQSCNCWIVRVNMLSKRSAGSCVFVTVIHDCVIRQRSEIVQSSDHVFARAVEESTAASDEECIASEDTSRMVLIHVISYVVADGIPGMAGCG